MSALSGREDSQVSRQQVRPIRGRRFARYTLVITLGVASVCAGACRDSASTSRATSTVKSQPSSSGDVAPGETPAGAQFAAWLTAFNAGNRDALVAYHQKHFPYEVASDDVQGIDRELGLSQGTGGFELKKPVKPTATSIVAILKERRSEQFALASMEVDAAAPHRVVRFEIHPIPTPAEFLPPEQRASRQVDEVPVRSPGDETPAARQFSAWLTTFNSGDLSAMLAYHQQHFPYEVASDDVRGIHREFGLSTGTGGFELKKPETPTPTSIVAILKERSSDQFARASMEVDAAAPHRVVRFEIHPITTPPELRPHLTEAELLAALRAELEKQAAADMFSGAVIVAKNGKPIFAEAYGFADRAKQIKNTLDTRFRIGSMNKMFTAVATLQLVQAKKLALTDPLAKALPKYANQNLANKVTIHHLLTHTGGTGDIFGPEYDKQRLELRTLADYVKLYGARDLAFEPGAKMEYSNYGFLLLGVVIEAVSKQTYFDYVEKRVFKPAGMTSTSSPMEDKATEPNRSIGYMRGPKPGSQPNTDMLPIRATSAGGGDSTAKDLLAFANALTRNKLLDAEHTKLLTTGKVDMGPNVKYAYGFVDSVQDGRRCVGHGGGFPGMNGQLTICDDGYTIVVLANLDPPAAGRIEKFVLARLPTK
jgi:D-alanyl-D-alanine carboxypeptidase